MTDEEAKQLIAKYNAGKCTDAEKALLDDWYYQFNEHPANLPERHIEEVKKQVRINLLKIQYVKKTKLLAIAIGTAAASFVFAIAIWMFIQYNIQSETLLAKDIAPGSNKATITLANGTTANLSQEESEIRLKEGVISYTDGTKVLVEKANFEGNATIATPKGGEYKLILDDGTKVWLNASSSIAFPSRFDGSHRNVKISGEVYFEVAKDKARPFVISVNNQTITVLGTQFNVNAYDDQALSTTLVEGSVRLNSKTILKPGETAMSTPNDTRVSQVDVSLITAWKNGKIQFEDADLNTVMAMLIRWYDIEISYSFYPQDARFSGSISKHKNISEVLRLLESTREVHFKIEGRRVIVEE